MFTAGRPARGALARAKMQSLGCAKKEKLAPQAPRGTEEKGVKTDDSLNKVGKIGGIEDLIIVFFFLGFKFGLAFVHLRDVSLVTCNVLFMTVFSQI